MIQANHYYHSYITTFTSSINGMQVSPGSKAPPVDRFIIALGLSDSMVRRRPLGPQQLAKVMSEAGFFYEG